MNKNEFLLALRSKLSNLPEEDIEKSAGFYSEIIDDHIEDGLSEEEAVSVIGSVDEIASQIMSEISLPKLIKSKVRTKRHLKAWEIVLLALGSPIWLTLLAAAAIVILSLMIVAFAVYIVVWAAIITMYAADLSIAVGAVAGVLGCVLYLSYGNFVSAALLMGAGLFCAGVSLLLFFGLNWLSKWILFATAHILPAIRYCFLAFAKLIF